MLRSTVPCSSRSSLTFILEQYRFGVRALDIDALGKIGKSCYRTEVALRGQREWPQLGTNGGGIPRATRHDTLE